MQYRVFIPHPAVRRLVKQYLIVESTTPTEEPIEGHIVPDGHLEIGFNFGERFEEFASATAEQTRWITKPRAYIDTLMDQYVVARSTGRIGLIGVKLHYAAAHAILPFEVSILRGGPLALESIFGAEGRILEDQILCASSHQQRIDALDQFFLRILQADVKPDALVETASQIIVACQGTPKVGDIARRLHVSRRHLEKRFVRCLGMTPKRFAQMTRVRSIIRYHARTPQVSLTKIAYQHGFFDQSHFIKEFKLIAGLTPTAFFKQQHFVSDLIQASDKNASLLSH